MILISVGPSCLTATELLDNKLRKESFPFDYIWSSLEMIEHCIEDKLKHFLIKNI